MILVEKVDATCFADGNIEYYICPLGEKCVSYDKDTNLAYMCDKNLNTVTNTVIEQLTHQPIKGAFNAATCSNYGYRANVCGVCDSYIETTNFAKMIEHKFGETEVIDSCADGKKIIKVCLVCDYEDVNIERPAGHVVTYNGVTNTLTSFCGDANTTRTCSVCNMPVVKNDHTFSAPALVDNMLKYVCTACGYAKTVEHTDHVWTEGACICGATEPVDTTTTETETEIVTEEVTEPVEEPSSFDFSELYWMIALLGVIIIATVGMILVANKRTPCDCKDKK